MTTSRARGWVLLYRSSFRRNITASKITMVSWGATYLDLKGSHHLQPKARTGPDVDGHYLNSINSKTSSLISRNLFVVLGGHPTLNHDKGASSPSSLIPRRSYQFLDGRLIGNASNRTPEITSDTGRDRPIARPQRGLPIPNHHGRLPPTSAATSMNASAPAMLSAPCKARTWSWASTRRVASTKVPFSPSKKIKN